MRISQLSAESGVPIPTIKYYLREGLLPSGEQRSATRAEYGPPHLRRLRLIRALLEVGLPVASIRKVIEAVEDEGLDMHSMLGTAHYAISPAVEPHEETPEWSQARELVDELIRELGWRIEAHAPGREVLAQTIVTLRGLGAEPGLADLLPYGLAMRDLVDDYEIHQIPFDAPREEAVEAEIIGTVLYGKALDAIRRLAHESASLELLGQPDRLPEQPLRGPAQ